MKDLKKLTAAVGLVGGLLASPAFAAQISIDNGVDGDLVDADSVTDPFDQFTLSNLTPVSIYYDLDLSGSVTTGDLVIDAATTTVGQLNPLAFPGSLEGFGSTWGLEVEWLLIGAAGVVDQGVGDSDGELDGVNDILGAQFFDGLVAFDYVGVGPLGANAGPELVLDVQSSNVALGGDVSVNVYGEVLAATPGVFTVESGQFAGADFADLVGNPLVDIDVTAGTNLLEGTKVPTMVVDPLATIFQNAGFDAPTSAFLEGLVLDFEADFFGANPVPMRFSRTTRLDSVDIAFEVPAPATLGLLGLGLLGLGARARKRS